LSLTTHVRRGIYRKSKTNRVLLTQETVNGSDIIWAICKSAPRSGHTTTPAPHHSVFTGRMPFLPPNQQRQSTEGNIEYSEWCRAKYKPRHLYHADSGFPLVVTLQNAGYVRYTAAGHYKLLWPAGVPRDLN